VNELNKKAIILISLMILTVIAFPCLSTVQAKLMEENHYGPPGAGFTEYYGTMGGANFYVLIPDDWSNPLGDGMLVVICRAAMWSEDPRDSITDYPFAMGLASSGIAVAASNYGSSDSGVEDGVIRTHQLTMYVIDNYDVTGKVFLFGTSLGGNVALLLGERHPNVYSGVLDNSGIKDWAAMYYDAVDYMTVHAGEDPFLDFWYIGIIASLTNTYGGTPDEKPNKYAKYSPTHHADISIPVISVVHEDDAIVNPTQTDLYHAALSDTALHIIVTVDISTPGAPPMTLPGFPAFSSWYGHFDPYTFMAAAENLFNLIVWSNTL